jgi:flagellar hook-basal body complex protein FliE
MTVIPSAAAAAYQAIAKIGAEATAAAGVTPANVSEGGANFGDFLSSAMKDTMGALKGGEQAAMKQVAGQAEIVDVVNAINNAELTLNTVVAVRDKVIGAYQDIMRMPI